MDPYENPDNDIEKRITDLLKRMTVEEKTCQMATLYGFGRVLQDELPTPEWKNRVWKDSIGNIDEHLNGLNRPATETQYSWPPTSIHLEYNVSHGMVPEGVKRERYEMDAPESPATYLYFGAASRPSSNCGMDNGSLLRSAG